jgi:NAD(P)H-dependent FMN reductase
MLKLHVVVASTRPQRAGLAVAQWFFERAKVHGKFDVVLVDLKEVNLPLFDEPRHPRFGQYEHAHTRAWSRSVAAADAFVFVTPEYNYGSPPALVNALDYLFVEWHYKPVGFVNYGGVSGGTRSAQMTKQIVTAVKMMPMTESVTIPFIAKQLDGNGVFGGGETHEKASMVMLDELLRWTQAMKVLRP